MLSTFGSFTSTISKSFNLTPPTPTNITVVSTTSSSVTLSFTPPTGISGITGYIATTTTGAQGSSTSSPITISGLGAGTTYTITIVTVNLSGISKPSSSINATTLAGYLFANDGSNLTGWTNGSPACLISSSIGNPVSSIQVSGNRAYAYYNLGYSFLNTTITFDVNVGTLCDFYFACNSGGAGQMFRSEGRGTGSGFQPTTAWTSWSSPQGGVQFIPGIWYSVKIIVSSSGVATWYQNNVLQSQTRTISNNGTYFGLQGDGGGGTSYYDNILIVSNTSGVGGTTSATNTGVPVQPVVTSIITTATSATVNYTAPINVTTGSNYYLLSGTTTVATSAYPATAVTVSNLIPNTTYNYYLIASNAFGNSIVRSVIFPLTLPINPVIEVVTTSATSTVLNLVNFGSNSSVSNSLSVIPSTSSVSINKNGTLFTVSGLTSNSSYFIGTTTSNAAGYANNGLGQITNTSFLITVASGASLPAISAYGQYVCLGCYGNGIYVSTNYGATFTKIVTEANAAHSAISDSGKYMFVACNNVGRLYWSSNYGTSFTSVTIGANISGITCSVLGSTVYACDATNGGIYYSTNYGVNWSAIVLVGANLTAIKTNVTGTIAYVTSTTSGKAYSYNLYSNSVTIYSPGGSTNVSGIAFSADGQYIYVCNSGGLCYASVNSGSSFVALSLASSGYAGILCDTTGKYVYLHNSSTTIYYSADYGSTFTSITLLSASTLISLNSNSAYMCISSGSGLYISTNRLLITTTPLPPTNLVDISNTSSTALIQFTPPQGNVSISGYVTSTTPTGGVGVGGASAYTVYDLSASTSYAVSVAATNSGGTSTYSEPITVITTTASGDNFSSLALNTTSNLVLYYRFDTSDVNGTLLANVSNAGVLTYSATMVGTTTVTTSKYKLGFGSLYFSNATPGSTSQYVTLPSVNLTSTNMTFVMWAYVPSVYAIGQTFVEFGNGSGSDNIRLWYGPVNTIYTSINGQDTSITTFTIGVWFHLAWVLNGSSWNVYINGASVYSATRYAPTTGTKNSNNLGRSPAYGNSNMYGYLDDFRFYKTNLAASDIISIYNYNPIPYVSPPTFMTNANFSLPLQTTNSYTYYANSGFTKSFGYNYTSIPGWNINYANCAVAIANGSNAFFTTALPSGNTQAFVFQISGTYGTQPYCVLSQNLYFTASGDYLLNFSTIPRATTDPSYISLTAILGGYSTSATLLNSTTAWKNVSMPVTIASTGNYNLLFYFASPSAYINTAIGSSISITNVSISAAFNPPTNLAVSSATTTGATLNFTPAQTSGISATSYGSTIGSGSGTPTAYNITGLTPNTIYNIGIVANYPAGFYYTGNSFAGSSFASNTLYVLTVPSAPTLAFVSATIDSATVTITTTGTGHITGYNLTTVPPTLVGGSGPGNAYSIAGLSPNTIYNLSIASINSAGTSSAGALTVTTVPTPPTDVIGTVVSDTNIDVAFTPPTGNGSISQYRVTSSPDAIVSTGTSSPITVTGLAANTPYTFTVTATNGGGTSAPSDPSSPVTTNLVPNPPTNLAVVSKTGSSVTVSFTPAQGTVVGYIASTSSGSQGTSTGSPITINGLGGPGTYIISIVTVNYNGTSVPSNSITESTPNATAIVSGGTVTTSGAYTIRTFTSSGTLTIGGGVTSVYALVVGGGGGGGADTGGGGGAGGVLYAANFAVSNGSYPITIGQGGVGGTGSNNGSNGGNTTFSTLTAIGGGGGGGARCASALLQGGSGGGGSAVNTYPSNAAGLGTAGQGYAGGAGVGGYSYGSGGGGAGGVGGSYTTAAGVTSAKGGPGITVSSVSGNPYYIPGFTSITNSAGTTGIMSFGGGGGGGTYVGGAAQSSGGIGGGGAGVGSSTITISPTGVPNTGGGGGGGGTGGAYAGTGGSGIVIISYLTSTGSSSSTNTGVPGQPIIDGPVITTASTVTVNFTAPANVTTGSTYSLVYGGTTYGTAAYPATTIVASGLTSNTLYKFNLTATNVNGTSVPTFAISAITKINPPTIGSATSITGTSATIGLTAPLGAAAGTTYSAIAGGISYGAAAYPDLSANVLGLSPNTTYSFSLTATNANGTSQNSSTLAITTFPTPPTNVIATTISDTIISVAFTASTGTSTITSYSITSSPGNIVVYGTSSPIVVTGLLANTSYTFTMTATNSQGKSSNSTASSPVTTNSGPSPPTNLAVVSTTNTSSTISFTPPQGTINYYLATTNLGQSYYGSGSPITIAGLNPSTSYTVTLQSIDAFGTSIASNSLNFTTVATVIGTVLSAPTIGSSSSITTNSATISFTAPSGAASGTVYNAYVDNTIIASAVYPATSINMVGLSPNTTYSITIKASNQYGTSPESSSQNVATVPLSPTDLSIISKTATSVYIGFTPITGNTTITAYTATDSGNVYIGTGSTSPIIVSGLSPSTTYSFSVTATNTSTTTTTSTFNPINITGLNLWLDAYDSASIVLSGSNVTQWNDKSGYNRHATLYSTAYSTYNATGFNSKPTIRFGSTACGMSSPMPSGTITRTGGITVFAVYNCTGSAFETYGTPFSRGYSNVPDPIDMYSTSRLAGPPSAFQSAVSTVNLNSISTPTLFSVAVGVSSWQDWVNGTLSWTSTFCSNFNEDANATKFFIGTRWDKVTNIIGNISEILVYNAMMTVDQRQSIEGYLCWKWGLQAKLPVSHPYYSFSPSSPVTTTITKTSVPSSSITVTTLLSAPTITTVSSVGTTTAVISFTAPTGAAAGTTYSAVAGGTTYGTASYPANTINITGLSPNTAYSLNVFATNSAGRSPASNAQSVTTVPTPPSNVFLGVASDTVINVGFNTIAGTAPITSYTAISSPGNYTYTGTSSPIFATGLTPNTAYSFTVTVTNSQGTSAPSAVINPSITNMVPNNPTNLNIVGITPNSVTVTFTPPVGTVISYIATTTTGLYGYSTGSPMTIGGLTSNTTYTATISSVGSLGTSSPSVSFTFTTPSMTNVSTISAFDPTTITGLVLWLDANYSNSLLVTGSNVYQWNDRSGSGNHFVQASSSNRPITGITYNNLQMLDFTNSKNMENSTMQFPAPPYTIFAVGYRNIAGYGRLLAGFSDTYLFFGTGNGTTNFATFVGSGSWNDVSTDVPGTPVSSMSIMGMTNSGTTTGLVPYVNCTSLNAKNGTSSTFTGLYLGKYGGGDYWNGYVGEILIYNSVLTSNQRQTIEGYLAWKWGLQSNIPTSHPYYSGIISAPTIGAISNITSTSAIINFTAPVGASTGTVYNAISGTTNYGSSSYPSTSIFVSGLTSNTSYIFSLTSTNAYGTSNASSTVTVVTLPRKITDVTKISVSSYSATVSFTAPTGAVPLTYSSTVGTGSGGPSTYVISGLSSSTTYSISVIATNTSGSTTSVPLTITTGPAAPTNLSASSVTATGATIDFTGLNATSFTLYAASQSIGSINSPSTTFVLSGLTPNMLYPFTITATNANGTSTPSNILYVTTLPIAPSTVTISGATDTTLSMTFSAPPGNAAIAYYASIGSSSGTYNNFTISGLNPNTTYTFNINAMNSAGTVVSPDFTATTVLSAPTGLTLVSSTTNTATFSFTGSVGATIGTSYNIVSGGTMYGTASYPSTTIIASDLSSNTAYSFSLTATNVNGTSVSSSSVSANTLPSPPTSIVANTLSDTAASVEFMVSAGTLPISTYTVTSSPGNITATGATSPVTIVGLLANTSYTFSVKATNVQGISVASSASNPITTNALPNPPTSLSGTSATASTITVGFTPPVGTITSYKYNAVDSSGNLYTNTFASPATSVVITGLGLGRSYTITLQTMNGSAISNSSSPLLYSTASYTIVTTSLVINLDSTMGISGNTWTDQTANGYNYNFYNNSNILTNYTMTTINGYQAISLNGTNYLWRNNASGFGTNFLSSFTYEMWVYPKTTANTTLIYENGQNGFGGWSDDQMGTNSSGYFTSYVYSGGSISGTTGGPYIINKWYQVVNVYDNTAKIFYQYVNGALTKQVSISKSYPGTIWLVLGSQAGNGSSYMNGLGYFNGYIGAFRGYNIALSAAQVLQNYNTYKTDRYY